MNYYNFLNLNKRHDEHKHLEREPFKIVSFYQSDYYLEFTIDKYFNFFDLLKKIFFKQNISLIYRFDKNKKVWLVPKGYTPNKKIIDFLKSKI